MRHKLHARKPMVISKDNIRLKKGVPTKVLWQKQGDTIPAQPPKAVPKAAPLPEGRPDPEGQAKGAAAPS